jgi:hypothetical protein
LVKDIYQATQSWPREELYGLTNQAAPVRSTPARRAGGGRRAAVSVPANIAEGKGRIGSQELLHRATGPDGPECFALSGLSIATGSLAETETLLLIARDLGYIHDEDTQRLLSQTNTVGQLIGGLRRSLRPTTERQTPNAERRTPPAAHETRDRPT